MNLHHKIQSLEEELVSTKLTITKLTRDMEEKKLSKISKEDRERKITELQREVSKLQQELNTKLVSENLINKLQQQLTASEAEIESLENKLGDNIIELERGAVALQQLDNYREQIKLKTKENRDLSLHIHGLETQLKNVPYMQSKLLEFSEELQDCKLKLEKIPGLLSEVFPVSLIN
jgi:chromosome segregation ATPase